MSTISQPPHGRIADRRSVPFDSEALAFDAADFAAIPTSRFFFFLLTLGSAELDAAEVAGVADVAGATGKASILRLSRRSSMADGSSVLLSLKNTILQLSIGCSY
jgi:hypothetical protein